MDEATKWLIKECNHVGFFLFFNNLYKKIIISSLLCIFITIKFNVYCLEIFYKGNARHLNLLQTIISIYLCVMDLFSFCTCAFRFFFFSMRFRVEQELYSWDKGNALTYPIRYHEQSIGSDHA